MAKVLIIEDEPLLRQLVRIVLTGRGHEVLEAENGKIGLAMIIDEHPDLVLLDLKMPKLNGYSVLKRLRAHPLVGDTVCMVISNSGQAHEVNRATKVGADGVLIKADITPTILAETVERMVKPTS